MSSTYEGAWGCGLGCGVGWGGCGDGARAGVYVRVMSALKLVMGVYDVVGLTHMF